MAILVIGGSGYVGLHLLQALACHWSPEDLAYTYNAHPPAFMQGKLGQGFCVDFATGEGITALQSAVRHPRVVVNCAAMSVPRECEQFPEEAMAVNVPRLLLQYMKNLQREQSPLLVHLSTDQVYEGTKRFYVEDDETKPVNMYGKSKAAAEEFIRSSWDNYVILRSSIIFGPQPVVPVRKSLPVQWMESVLSANKPVEFFDDEFRCPVFIQDLVKVVELLITKTSSEQHCVQWLFNLGGPDRLSRSEMAEIVAQVRGYDLALVQRVSAKSVDRGVASPEDISMNVTKLQEALGVELTPFAEGVKQTLIRGGLDGFSSSVLE